MYTLVHASFNVIRKRLSKSLLQRPKECLREHVIVISLDAIACMAPSEISNNRNEFR